MTQPRGRSLAAVEADLRSCRFIKVGAQLELAEVRRRQAELAEIEAVLVMTVECRAREADRLLDERLRAVAGVADLRPAAEPVDERRLTTF